MIITTSITQNLEAMLSTINLIFTLIVAASAQTNYCTLCTNHVACNNNGQFVSTCPIDASIVTMTNTTISTFLNTHNTLRNKIASGNQAGFLQAKQMMTVKWNAELAYLAELNVRKCKMSHDACFKTTAYPTAGQNLYIMMSSSFAADVNTVLSNAVNSWYNEVSAATQSDINVCCGGTKFSQIGHFTQVVRDKVVAIGCAASRYTANGWKTTLICCNYSYGNLLNTPVYVSGTAASTCSNGKDTTYTSLCKT